MKFKLFHLLVASLLVVLLGNSAFAGTEKAVDVVGLISQPNLFERRIVWAGTNQPPLNEAEELWEILQGMRGAGVKPAIEQLEEYLLIQTNSGWNFSLHANLGKYYRVRGKYTLALEHWQAAWNQGRHVVSGPVKEQADDVLVHWTRLLVSLGRVSELQKLFDETENRRLDAGPLQQIFNGTKEGFQAMKSSPDKAYRCGTYALHAVANAIAPYPLANDLLEQKSPETGFSIDALVELAKAHSLPIEGVIRTNGTRLTVPSVVHWKQNHFAAIVRQRGDRYYVVDPTFQNPLWLTAESINAEASGHFLILSTNLHPDFSKLAKVDADKIFGKGYPNVLPDGLDTVCPSFAGPTSSDGSGASSGGNGGTSDKGNSPCSSCGPSSDSSGPRPTSSAGLVFNASGAFAAGSETLQMGMPVWTVTEPFINLWVIDEPVGYSTAYGPNPSFRVSYKQRDEASYSSDVYGFGPLWKAEILSFVEETDDEGNVTTELFELGGGIHQFEADGVTIEPHTNTRLERTPSSGTLGSFERRYNSGATETYGFIVHGGTFSRAYLTQQTDPQGHSVNYQYSNANGIVRLLYVTDAQGLTNTILYSTNHPYSSNLIAGIVNPFGKRASFLYASSGHLTNIVDAIGMSSSFAYDGNGWITNMITPYGTNSFNFQVVMNGALDGKRAITVTSPTGSKERFLYTDMPNSLINVGADVSRPLSNTLPANLEAELDSGHLDARMSYHWAPQQYSQISASGQSDISNLSSNDFRLSHMRHWMHGIGGVSIVKRLGYEIAPPATTNSEAGLRTWYSYPNKPSNQTYYLGTNLNVSLIATRLPDNRTRFVWRRFDFHGNVTNEVSNYTLPDGSTAYRTNVFVYAPNSSDLLMKIGYSGEIIVSNTVSDHLIIRSENGVGDVTAYTHYFSQQIRTIVTPAGLTITNVYDSQGFLSKSVALEIARTNSFVFSNGLLRVVTDERGLVSTNSYDALERLTGATFSDGSSVSNVYTRLDITARKDRLGKWSYTGYDSIRRKVSETDALGRTTTFSYCDCGAVNSITDPLNQTTQFTYDLVGNLVSTSFPDGTWVTNLYDPARQLLVNVSSGGDRITNAFTVDGLVYARSNTVGALDYSVLDIDGHVAWHWDEKSTLITNAYDALGRIWRSVDNGTQWETLNSYQSNGLASHTYNRFTTYYTNDVAGRRTDERNANGENIHFTYNAAGDLVVLRDARGFETHWSYDVHGWVTNKTDHDNNILFKYRYDANGRLTNRWTPSKGNTFYVYDDVGNLTNVTYTNTAGISYQYDGLNRATNMTDAVGTTRFTYGPAGDLTSEDGPWSNDTVTAAQTNGLRASLQVAANGGIPQQAWSYGYDSMGRLRSVASQAGSFGYSYWLSMPTRLVAGISLPNGAYVTNNYNLAGAITSTEMKNSSGNILDSYSYARTSAGPLINRMTRNKDLSSVDYGYDNAAQLVQAVGREAGSALRLHEQFGYVYDAGGNLIWKTNGSLVQTFEVNGLNQLTEGGAGGQLTVAGMVQGTPTNVTVNGTAAELYADYSFARRTNWNDGATNTYMVQARDALARSDTQTRSIYLNGSRGYSYDLNGNLLSDGWRHFNYDDENQLITVIVTNATKSEFKYDGRMRRKVRKESVWLSGGWQPKQEVNYIYDRNIVIQERHYLTQLSSPVLQNIVTYTRGVDLSATRQDVGGIGGLLARTEGAPNGKPSTAYYHSDMLGNVTLLVDSNQQVVAHYLYEPFGSVLAMSGPLTEANTYRFSSKEAHDQSGLVYYLYRYYEPHLQKWVNRDPLADFGTRAGIYPRRTWESSLNGRNLHAFALNSPTEMIDPNGLFSSDENRPPSSATASGTGGPIHYGPPASSTIGCCGGCSRYEWDWEAAAFLCVDRPRDCGRETANCAARGVIVCYALRKGKSMGGDEIGLVGGAYAYACYLQKVACDKWNKTHGF